MSFWSGRRVLVTGHTGFKGAWLSLWLLRAGARLSGLALAPATRPNLFTLLDLEREMQSTVGDIRDFGSVVRCIDSSRPEVVFHLAAQAIVRASYAHPVETYATNVLGTAHVLEASRTAGVERAIVVTSDKCYRNDERRRPFREGDPLGGEDPYSSSKAGAELVAHAYAASYGSETFRTASARAGNVIGGGDWSADRLVPDVLRSMKDERPLRLRYPHAVRPWQHVLEPVAGYVLLAEAMDRGDFGAWNFGPLAEDHVTVEELARTLYDALGQPVNIEVDKSDHPHEAGQLHLDSTKAREELGWHGKLSAGEAIAWTAAWHRAVADGASPREITLHQIEEYATR
jgi:CDP-glucose 4,6-dehydratase